MTETRVILWKPFIIEVQGGTIHIGRPEDFVALAAKVPKDRLLALRTTQGRVANLDVFAEYGHESNPTLGEWLLHEELLAAQLPDGSFPFVDGTSPEGLAVGCGRQGAGLRCVVFGNPIGLIRTPSGSVTHIQLTPQIRNDHLRWLMSRTTPGAVVVPPMIGQTQVVRYPTTKETSEVAASRHYIPTGVVREALREAGIDTTGVSDRDLLARWAKDEPLWEALVEHWRAVKKHPAIILTGAHQPPRGMSGGLDCTPLDLRHPSSRERILALGWQAASARRGGR